MKSLGKLSTVFFVLAIALTTARAATLNVPATFNGTVTHEWSPFGLVQDSLDMTVEPIEADLGLLTDMKINLAVEDCERVMVDLPPGMTGFISMNLIYRGTVPGNTSTNPLPYTFTFTEITGETPVLDFGFVGEKENGNGFNVIAEYVFDEPFSFMGWEVDIQGPFASAGPMTYTPLEPYFRLLHAAEVDAQFVSVIPEPSAITLGLLSLGCLVWARRRRA